MARPADPRKSAAWLRRLHRFTASGTTVSNFCDQAGVSAWAECASLMSVGSITLPCWNVPRH